MNFTHLPPLGAWRLLGVHDGFEITQFVTKKGNDVTVSGTSLGIESGTPWNFHYTIDLDPSWRALSAVIENNDGARLHIQADGVGHWTINGKRCPELDNCLDLDLEGSVVTNTAPIHRLALEVNQKSEAPAVYIRTQNLQFERLEQTYQRLADSDNLAVFDYDSPRFDYHDRLRFASDGLIVDYPGIGARVL